MSVQTSEPGFTLYKLKHDDFHQICGITSQASRAVPDAKVGPAFTRISVGDEVYAQDGFKGTVSGFAVDRDVPTPFARVSGRLYHISTLRLNRERR